LTFAVTSGNQVLLPDYSGVYASGGDLVVNRYMGGYGTANLTITATNPDGDTISLFQRRWL
jgi:hypothetical protein